MVYISNIYKLRMELIIMIFGLKSHFQSHPKLLQPIQFNSIIILFENRNFNTFLVKYKNHWRNLLLGFVICLSVVVVFNMSTGKAFAQNYCTSDNIEDIDGDNILNNWEINGTDINHDNLTDLDLNQLGSSPYHKDLFLEVDFMSFHKPYSKVIPDVITAFGNAPVCNPDGVAGINLHVELGDEIPHDESLNLLGNEDVNGKEEIHFNDFYKIKSEFFGNEADRMSPNRDNILDAKNSVYHYALFIHTFNGEGYSGIAKDIPASDFVVSLGHDTWPVNQRISHNTGTA